MLDSTPLQVARVQCGIVDSEGGPYPRTLLETKLKGDAATEPGAIVLRDFGPEHHDANRYVTHMRVDYRDQPRPGYSSGHYFDDRDEAIRDYWQRVNRNRSFKA